MNDKKNEKKIKNRNLKVVHGLLVSWQVSTKKKALSLNEQILLVAGFPNGELDMTLQRMTKRVP